MDLNATLRSSGGIEAIASQLGIPREQAERGAAALLPAIVGGMGRKADADGGAGGMGRKADADGGAGGLGSLLDSLGGGGLADNVTGPEPTRVDDGNAILGGIFGSKDTSRAVAADASAKSGIDPALLKKMLPILAMLVAGYLSQRGGAGGGLGGVLGQVLGQVGGGGGMGGGLGGGLGSVLGSILGRPR